MKQIISLLTAVVLVFSLFSIPVCAARIGGDEGVDDIGAEPNSSQSVDITITVSGATVDKYAVDIEFETMEFSYSTGSTWDPSTHTYKPGMGGSWSPAKNISIANHSNKGIDFAVSTTKENGAKFAGLSIVTDPANGQLAGCEVNGVAPSTNVGVSITGTPAVGEIYNEKLGTVTVTVTKTA